MDRPRAHSLSVNYGAIGLWRLNFWNEKYSIIWEVKNVFFQFSELSQPEVKLLPTMKTRIIILPSINVNLQIICGILEKIQICYYHLLWLLPLIRKQCIVPQQLLLSNLQQSSCSYSQ